MSSCDAQRFFEGALALFDAVETEEGDAFEAMKLCVPLPGSCFLLRLYPLPHRGERRRVLTLPRQRLGQPGKAVGAKHHRAEPAGKRIAQAGDRLVERTLRDQRGAAKEPRFHHEPEPLLGDERLGCLESLQRQLRLAAIDVKYRVEHQGEF